MKARCSAGALALGVLLTTAACGGASAITVEATANFLARSADRTTSTRTGHVTMTMSLGTLPVTGEGDYDLDAHQASMSMDMSGLADSLGSLDASGASAAAARTMFADPIEIV